MIPKLVIYGLTEALNIFLIGDGVVAEGGFEPPFNFKFMMIEGAKTNCGVFEYWREKVLDIVLIRPHGVMACSVCWA